MNPKIDHIKEPLAATELLQVPRGNREWRKKAGERLHGTMRSAEKMAERTRFLAEHPEQKIVIDTELLKDVVNYDVFKCHPDCSVGRDEAVQGSDIDGGIVVTDAEVPSEKQQEFVDRLRLMGFNCNTKEELDKLLAIDQSGMEPARVGELQGAISHARSELIGFATREQMSAAIEGARNNGVFYNDSLPGNGTLPLDILVVGHEIQ